MILIYWKNYFCVKKQWTFIQKLKAKFVNRVNFFHINFLLANFIARQFSQNNSNIELRERVSLFLSVLSSMYISNSPFQFSTGKIKSSLNCSCCICYTFPLCNSCQIEFETLHPNLLRTVTSSVTFVTDFTMLRSNILLGVIFSSEML